MPDNKGIVDREDAPEFLKENKYLKRGFRAGYIGYRRIFGSLFECHNETVNVWTHLAGAMLSLVLTGYLFLFFEQHFEAVLKEKWSELNNQLKQSNVEKVMDISVNGFKQQTIREFNFENKNEVCTELQEYSNGLLSKFKQEALRLKTFLAENKYLDILNKAEKKIESLLKASYLGEINEELRLILKESDHLFSCREEKGAKTLSSLPLYVFLLSGVLCLGFSATFHLFGAHSKKMHSLLNKLDYAGISILVAGSCYPPYYYYFYCSPGLMYFYLGLISFFSFLCFVFSLNSRFATRKYQAFRGTLFILLGLAATLPMLHRYLVPTDFTGFVEEPGLLCFWMFGGISYITGALIYISRFPECKFPGMFDFVVYL